MTIAEQLHNSATHKKPFDRACPICNPVLTKLTAICNELSHCAKLLEYDGELALTEEQHRTLKILRKAFIEIAQEDANAS